MRQKPYWEMTTQELDEATKQFDEPFVVDRSRPLTPPERDQWKRVKRKRGRPKVGQGYKREARNGPCAETPDQPLEIVRSNA
jgi:hypothetical protein